MAATTAIEWTEATWNIITGCSVTSPGCTNCYAMKLAGERLSHHPSRAGLTKEVNGKHVWTGEVRFNDQWLEQPIRWARGRMIFTCAHGDLFHENVPDEWIDKVFAVMALSPQHIFQVLTKRPERMRDYIQRLDGLCSDSEDGIWPMVRRVAEDLGADARTMPDVWPFEHVWLGVSAEDQARWDERVPILRDTPAAVRWVSAEPLIGPIEPSDDDLAALDWIVVGAESKAGARLMRNDWAQAIVDRSQAADVAVHVKQLSGGGSKVIKDMDRFPPSLRVREYPKVRELAE